MLMRALIIAVGVFAASGAAAGKVTIGGTGAAAAMFETLAARYAAAAPDDGVEVVRGLGSGGGIAAAAEGALQIALSSRPLKPDERARGVVDAPFLDTPFVFVTSHPKAQSLARADIAAIYEGRKRTWADGAEIKPILRPRSDSMTPWMAQNLPGVGPAMEKLRARPEVPVAATDHDNIQMAEAVPNSLAPATLMQILAERPRLRLVAIDGVEPSLAAMQGGAWRDAFRVWIVTAQAPDAATRRFLDWLRTPEAVEILRENGAAPVEPAGPLAHVN
ncbi:MAG: substrate-binding domain-containing protein [Methylobacteriaceae bacterium]|nr:substrate-binding domain-containing protein [Methylobacteriaceae bacterium]